MNRTGRGSIFGQNQKYWSIGTPLSTPEHRKAKVGKAGEEGVLTWNWILNIDFSQKYWSAPDDSGQREHLNRASNLEKFNFNLLVVRVKKEMYCLMFLAFISWVGMFYNPRAGRSFPKNPIYKLLIQFVESRGPAGSTKLWGCLIYLNMRAAPAAGREKSMQIIIYDRCTILPKAQFRSVQFWSKTSRGWIHLSVIGTPVREPCHKCHKCLRILRKSDFSEHRKYSCLVGTNPFISYLEQSEADSVRNVINGWETRVVDDSDS